MATITVASAPSFAPGFVELFGVRKNMPFSGTRGMTTWQMETTNNYLSIGWSVPYNRVLFDNLLMAGVNCEDPQRCFNQLYCKSQTWFQRKCFNKELNGSLKFSLFYCVEREVSDIGSLFHSRGTLTKGALRTNPGSCIRLMHGTAEDSAGSRSSWPRYLGIKGRRGLNRYQLNLVGEQFVRKDEVYPPNASVRSLSTSRPAS
ncbi:hypothetical protein TCAL_16834 [Tigriopus californicus]|uniref:Uncharacterized protein n=1 Tax=Tigriopus californicus TaxID=6832 RepID=A0A553PC53_TIGCA|nr:hypothetical protein TCAL_16834 [Tigriopus californicus]